MEVTRQFVLTFTFVFGPLVLAIQCILNDFLIWAYKFPW